MAPRHLSLHILLSNLNVRSLTKGSQDINDIDSLRYLKGKHNFASFVPWLGDLLRILYYNNPAHELSTPEIEQLGGVGKISSHVFVFYIIGLNFQRIFYYTRCWAAGFIN